LLPAVQAAREAARRMACQSALHNLALGVLNYEIANKGLPQGTDGSVDARMAVNIYNITRPQLSWIVRCLPQLEQQAAYQQFNLKQTFTEFIAPIAAGAPRPEQTQPEILMCPSDSAQGRVFQSGRIPLVGPHRVLGKGNYVAFASPEHIECELVAEGALSNDIRPLSTISDGTSNTLLLSEVRTLDNTEDERGAWALGWNGATLIGGDVHGATTDLVRICGQDPATRRDYTPGNVHPEYALLPNAPLPSASTGAMDNLRSCGAGSTQEVESSLQGMPCRQRGDTTVAPRSLHTGGVNVANIDGSVRFLVDGIDVVTYGRLICINDGQQADAQ